MRLFSDLCLKSNISPCIISTVKTLGYNLIGLYEKTYSSDIKIIRHLDLDPKTPNDIQKNLNKKRFEYDIILAICKTKSVARKAGTENRIDLISFPVLNNWKQNHLDIKQARLMKDAGIGYLIDLSQLLVDDNIILRKRIEFLKRNIKNALKKGVRVVGSSCASDSWGLRDPYGLVSLLCLLDVDEDHALDMISRNPYSIVEQNLGKLKDSYIGRGVWIIDDY